MFYILSMAALFFIYGLICFKRNADYEKGRIHQKIE